MHSRRFAALLLLSAISAITARAAEEALSRDDLLAEFAKLLPPDAITESHTLNSNGFTLEFDRYKQLGEGLEPNGKEFQSLFVSASGAFRTQVVKGVLPNVDNGVSIYHRDSGTPLLALSDSDGDGRPDMLTYWNVDAAGEASFQVTDYDMDGQPDLRINYAEHRVELWHLDRWYRVETRDGHRGIVVDGKFVEVRNEKSRLFVP